MSDGNERSPSRHRGQSEIVGMILLLGVITVGALLTVAVGGMALQSFQENAEGGLAEDTAVQAHASLAEVASTGTPQNVPTGEGAVDSRLVDGGTLTISMYDGSGTCSVRVRENLGALRYEGGDRAMIYEGGAIWAETDAGLAIERTPPISHGPDGTRISVLSVASATIDDGGELVARPNESARQRVAGQIEELLTRCPANGFTSLRINVTSPYADGWERHFREAVATTPNVDVIRNGDAVVANISNATAATSTDGLGLASVDAPLALGPGDHFPVAVGVGNDDFDAANASVELDVANTTIARSNDVTVSAFGVATTRFNVTPSVVAAQFTSGATHNYTITLRADDGTVLNATTGAVSYGTTAPRVTLDRVADSLGPGERRLTINATLHNYGLVNGTGNATIEFTDPAISTPPRTSPDVDVAAGGSTTISFDLNVSGLAAGVYDYAVVGPNGTHIADSFRITNRTGGGVVVGDLRVRSVDASDTMVETGEGFDVTLEVENIGNASTTGTATLDVAGLSAVDRTVTLSSGEVRDVTLSLSASEVDSLAVGAVHDYTVELASGGDTESLTGSFYLGNSGADLGVDSVTATQSDGTVVVDATLSNDGLANGTDTAVLSLTGAGGTPINFSSPPQQNVTTQWGATSSVTFDLNVSSLGGNYTATVSYGGEAASDTFSLGGFNGSDSNVTITGGGVGTVTVLGTEISAEGPVDSDDEDGDWEKYWAPTSVTVERTTNGVDSDHQFQNDAGDVVNESNLNSYDTQEETYSYSWNQTVGDSTSITIQSTFWNAKYAYTPVVNERDANGRHWRDQQPGYGLGRSERRVDASADQHPENVQVLTDGDRVPEVSGVLPDQRNATEVLNQGVGSRIDPDTNRLDLGPYEAVFLFEMTETTDDVPGNMWEYALENNVSDPDYNDVIAVVEFDPVAGGTVPVEMDVTGGSSGLTIGTPGVASPPDGNVTMNGTSVDEGEGSTPGSEPDVGGSGPTGPSEPDDVVIEIDVIQID